MTRVVRKNFPMQPIVLARDRVIRFQENRIVSELLRLAWDRLDLNAISARMQEGAYTRAEYMQLLQLTGYSVSGFGDSDLVDKRVVRRADQIAARVARKS